MHSVFLVLVLCLLIPAFAFPAGPVPVIFDTDMGNDIDDALALAMLHAFESRGESKLLAVTLSKDNPWAAVYVDLVNHFYGRGSIPIGMVKDGKTPQDSKMIRLPAERTHPGGAPLYPRKLTSGMEAPDAVELLRRTLASQYDGTVAIVQVGFSTNLSRLLDSPPDSHSALTGRELVKRKVKLLSMMAGAFPEGKPEYNVKVDIPAARKVLEEWPGPIVLSGFEIGLRILYPARSIENDYRYAADHPIVDAYRAYEEMPYDRPTWDLTSVLYAVRPDRGYFSLSPPGRVRVLDDGRTKFTPDPAADRRYLVVNGEQRTRVLESLVYLASQPPDRTRIR